MQQRLIWQDGAPRRVRTKPTASDQVAADLLARMQPFIKSDDGASAEALLIATSGLSSEAQTEWQARVAWMYYLQGNDEKARELGALAANGYGDWAVQGRWMGALAAWRQNDCHAAETGFENVAARANDVDLRAAGLYWAARADIVCARPDKVQARLTSAAQFRESFYGQLARQALGLRDQVKPGHGLVATEWSALERRPNIRVAAALVELGETELADDVIRQQARIGNPAEFASLVRLAETLDLPATTLWLAHNCPQGVTTLPEARYPTPNWTPDSGWRVDKSLVYAHALEESRFRSKVTSPAGAYGLMQIMPAAAVDFARERGLPIDKNALSRPSTNMDIGQRHLERLRDMMGITGGLLPKVIAAYNAGPKPVGEWNSLVHDNGDPLLYIESIPYWEGRAATSPRSCATIGCTRRRTASPNRPAAMRWPRACGRVSPVCPAQRRSGCRRATSAMPLSAGRCARFPPRRRPVVMAAAAPASATAPSSAPSDTDALRAAAAAMAMQRPKASISFSAAEPGGVR